MRFFHLSDLHIGKYLHHYNLKEDQRYILKQIVSYAKKIHPDAIVIAGDVYDKSVPSAEAVTLFDDFLTELSEIEPVIPILLISGNHDSAERLEYASRILRRFHVYMSGSVPQKEDELLQKVTLSDAYGEVDFYLLPFMKPSYVRSLAEESVESYTEAIQMILAREQIDYSKRNVLVSHQFYTAGSLSPRRCDSETVSVGGIDNVDISIVEQFDYVALGHIHGAQTVGKEHIRYCGTPLKYSVSEAEHEKVLTMIVLNEKGNPPEVCIYPLIPLRDVKKKKGTLKEILENAVDAERKDYVSITLTDEIDPYRPKERLENVYEKILEIRVDNARTRGKLEEMVEDEISDDPFEMFLKFFREMQGRELMEDEFSYMQELFEQAKGE